MRDGSNVVCSLSVSSNSFLTVILTSFGRLYALLRCGVSATDFNGTDFRFQFASFKFHNKQSILQRSSGDFDPFGQHECALELPGSNTPVEEGFLVAVDLLAANDELIVFDGYVQFIASETGHGEGDAQTVARQFLDVIGRIAVGRGFRRTFEQPFEMVKAQKERAIEIDVAVHSQSPPGALPVPKTATGSVHVAASEE